MKLTRIQDKNTLEIIQYRVNDKRVKKHQYEQALDVHTRWKRGCRKYEFTSKTKTGNLKEDCYLSY